MTLLAILISLALERLLPAVDEWRSLVWFRHYQGWLRGRLAAHEKWQGIPALLLIVLTLPLIVPALSLATTTSRSLGYST